MLESTTITAYVDRVGQRLAQVSDRPTVDYDFTVLDNDLVNAFAVPGGFVFITRGLLEKVTSEPELAMVIGHEISHVAAMHGVQMIQKSMGQNALTILGSIGAMLTVGPEAMLMVKNTADLFSSLYLLGYSRDKELEADNLGLQYLLRAGYDPRGSLDFFKKLDAMHPEEIKGWDLYFRSHPTTKERIHIIESMIGRDVDAVARPHEDDFTRIKSFLPKVADKDRGKIEGQSYIDPLHELTLKVPSNWVLGYYFPQALVSFHTVDNDGEGRLQMVLLSSVTETAADAAKKFTKDAGFQLISGRDVLYQAGYGYLGRYLGVSPGGKVLDIRLFATIRRGRGYILMAGAPVEKSDQYALDLEAILRALKFG